MHECYNMQTFEACVFLAVATGAAADGAIVLSFSRAVALVTLRLPCAPLLVAAGGGWGNSNGSVVPARLWLGIAFLGVVWLVCGGRSRRYSAGVWKAQEAAEIQRGSQHRAFRCGVGRTSLHVCVGFFCIIVILLCLRGTVPVLVVSSNPGIDVWL